MSAMGTPDLSMLLGIEPVLSDTGVSNLMKEINALAKEVHMTMLPEAEEVVPKLVEVSKPFGTKLWESFKEQITSSGGLRALLGGVMGGDIAGVAGMATGMGGEMAGEAIGGLFGGAGGPIGAAIGAAVGSAAGDAIKKVMDTITEGLALAFPGLTEQFSWIMKDLKATVGQTFLPVMEWAMKGFKLFGDILATILPNAGEMEEALAPITAALEDFESMIRDMVSEIGPAIRETLIVSIRLLAEAMRVLITYVKQAVLVFLQISGLGGLMATLGDIFGTGMRSQTGAAARPASITGVEEYQKSLQIAAASQPGQQGTTLKDLDGRLINIYQRLTDVFLFITDPVGQVVKKSDQVIDNAVEKVWMGAGASESTAKKASGFSRGFRHGLMGF